MLYFCRLISSAPAVSRGSSTMPGKPRRRKPQYMAKRVTRGSSPSFRPRILGSKKERRVAAVR